MSWNETFGELRSITQAQPDQISWERLMGLLLTAYEDDALRDRIDEIALPYVEAALSRWPDLVCALSATLAEQLDAELAYTAGWAMRRPRAPWRLVRTLPINQRTSQPQLTSRVQALPSLRVLDASWAMTGDGAIDWLISSGHIQRFRDLVLRWNKLETKHVKHLMEAADLAKLRGLDLSYNDLLDAAVTHIAARQELGELRSLTLIRAKLTNKGVARLLKKPAWTALQHLDLSVNEVAEPGAAAIVKSKLPLQTLILNQAKLDDAAILTLCKLRAPELLRQLELAYTTASDPTLAALLDNPAYTAIEHLALPNTQTAALTAAAIAQNPALASLRELSLNRTKLDADALAALARSPHLTSLRALGLDSAPIDDAALDLLADSPLSCQLEALDLTRTQVSAAGLARLVAHPNMGALRTLRAEFTPAAADPEAAARLLSDAAPHVHAALTRVPMEPYRWSASTSRPDTER
jgi:hypothetical protein